MFEDPVQHDEKRQCQVATIKKLQTMMVEGQEWSWNRRLEGNYTVESWVFVASSE